MNEKQKERFWTRKTVKTISVNVINRTAKTDVELVRVSQLQKFRGEEKLVVEFYTRPKTHISPKAHVSVSRVIFDKAEVR